MLSRLQMKGYFVGFIFFDQKPDGLDHELIFRFYRKRAASQDQSVEFFTKGAHLEFLEAANRAAGIGTTAATRSLARLFPPDAQGG